MSHTQLTPENINEIAILKRSGMLQKDRAQLIGVTPSAISQEIARNKMLLGDITPDMQRKKGKKEGFFPIKDFER